MNHVPDVSQIPEWAASPDDISGEWAVAFTHGKHEKRFARDLIDAGIPHYLPQERFTWRSPSGRRNTEWRLLFGSYCFFIAGGFVDERQWLHVGKGGVGDGKVINVIRVRNQQRLRSELADLYHRLASGIVSTVDLPLINSICRVRSGTMMGIQGQVIRTDPDTGMVTLAGLMGAPTEIPAGQLEQVA